MCQFQRAPASTRAPDARVPVVVPARELRCAEHAHALPRDVAEPRRAGPHRAAAGHTAGEPAHIALHAVRVPAFRADELGRGREQVPAASVSSVGHGIRAYPPALTRPHIFTC